MSFFQRAKSSRALFAAEAATFQLVVQHLMLPRRSIEKEVIESIDTLNEKVIDHFLIIKKQWTLFSSNFQWTLFSSNVLKTTTTSLQ